MGPGNQVTGRSYPGRIARVVGKHGGKMLRCAAAGLFLAGSGAVALADNTAYVTFDGGNFGTLDLTTGVYSNLGNSGQSVAGLAVENGTLYASAYKNGTGDLFTVNTTNGALTVVGASSVDYFALGSTTSGGLYVIGTNADLYSINASNGAATLIGPTGLSFGRWDALSTNSPTLYFSSGTNLYTVNTTTGATSSVGLTGGAQLGALLEEGGTLYGGQDLPTLAVATLNTSTGAATTGPALSGTGAGIVFGLAPYPIPASRVPEIEPASAASGLTLLLGALLVLRGRRSVKLNSAAGRRCGFASRAA
jgi:hypothetical protein